MGFKQSGFPMHSGTKNHSSALKQQALSDDEFEKIKEQLLKGTFPHSAETTERKIDPITGKIQEDHEAETTERKIDPITGKIQSDIPAIPAIPTELVGAAKKGYEKAGGKGFKKPSWLGKAAQDLSGASKKAAEAMSKGVVKKGTKAATSKSKKAYGGTRTWAEGVKASGGKLDSWVTERGKHKKGSADYNKYQNLINEALGSKVRHTKAVATTPKEKKIAKVEKSIGDATVKTEKIIAEKGENLDVKIAKKRKKIARIKHGRGSKEHLEAKKVHLQSKEADIEGKRGGRKRGIFRGLATKISKKRQANIQKKIDEETGSPAKDMKTGKYKQKFEKK